MLLWKITPLAVVVTSFQNPEASRMAQLLCRTLLPRAKIQKFPKKQ